MRPACAFTWRAFSSCAARSSSNSIRLLQRSASCCNRRCSVSTRSTPVLSSANSLASRSASRLTSLELISAKCALAQLRFGILFGDGFFKRCGHIRVLPVVMDVQHAVRLPTGRLLDLGIGETQASFGLDLSFPKTSSGVDSHYERESSHHSESCLRSCTRSECSSPTCSSRGGDWKPRTCFSVISSTLP
jgi:hypothetical protein